MIKNREQWKPFHMVSGKVVKKTMRQSVIIDGRNIYDKTEMQELGFSYYCIEE